MMRIIVLLVSATLLFVAGIATGWYSAMSRQTSDVYDVQAVMTDTVIVHDTVTIIRPHAVREEVIRYAEVGRDGLLSNMPADSPVVKLPIVKRIYEDSSYRAVVSGYDVSLDSLEVFRSREVVNIKPRKRMKQWGIGISAGYGFTPRGHSPYIGIGITWTPIHF